MRVAMRTLRGLREDRVPELVHAVICVLCGHSACGPLSLLDVYAMRKARVFKKTRAHDHDCVDGSGSPGCESPERTRP